MYIHEWLSNIIFGEVPWAKGPAHKGPKGARKGQAHEGPGKATRAWPIRAQVGSQLPVVGPREHVYTYHICPYKIMIGLGPGP